MCRVTAVLSAFMWTCWICSRLTYQSALFSSLREALNIHRLFLSAAATDSPELLAGKLPICVFTSHRCVHVSACRFPPVCMCERAGVQLLFGAWAGLLSNGREGE